MRLVKDKRARSWPSRSHDCRFAIEPSIGAVARWAQHAHFKFPTRRKHDGELEWRELSMGRLMGILHNPTYAGVYVYGRKPTRKVISDGEIRERATRIPVDEWPVRIDAAHPAYISWETFVSNEQRLRENMSKMHGATAGAPKNGPALLAGILLCGRCGRRMRVDYTTGDRTYWRYLCPGKHMTGGAICWSVNGDTLDTAVENLFLETMIPSEIDLSIAVEREAHDQAASLAAQWQTRIEQARYEARHAERRYKAVDPENRVVARTLEREWESRLADLDEVERQYAATRRERRVELMQMISPILWEKRQLAPQFDRRIGRSRGRPDGQWRSRTGPVLAAGLRHCPQPVASHEAPFGVFFLLGSKN
jgi:gamma-glutamylcyclotransferase (GGCT)/AIG2-like uncharacterized protein YtfP